MIQEAVVYFFLIVLVVAFLIGVWRDLKRSGNALPTFDEYRARHSSTQRAGVACYKCHSTHMRNLGANGMYDESRIV
jgi:hypothetical protein